MPRRTKVRQRLPGAQGSALPPQGKVSRATTSRAARRSLVLRIAHSPGGRAVLLGAAAGLVYLFVAGDLRFHFVQSPHPHLLLLADAFLHGQSHVRPQQLAAVQQRDEAAADQALAALAQQRHIAISELQRQQFLEQWHRGRSLLDWSVVDGKYYGYWGPLAPALLTPVVALFGPGVSDRLIDALFGALNVALFYVLLRRADRAGWCATTEPARIALTVLLAFGTVHFYSACIGSVWFSVQIITLTALLVACILSCAPQLTWRAALLSGAAFGAAILGRNIVVLIAPYFLTLFWFQTSGPHRARLAEWLRNCASFALPCIAAILVQGAYNQARFGSPFDSGQKALMQTAGAAELAPDYYRYGQFHPHFLATNAKFYFWNWELSRDGHGRLSFDGRGNSMFIVTPPLLYLFLAWRRRNRLALALAAGVVPFMAGLLLFRTTGAYQFGNRYIIELLPLLLLLVAEGVCGRLTNISYVLIVLAIAVNLFGTCRFCQLSWPQTDGALAWFLGAFVLLALSAGAAGAIQKQLLRPAGRAGPGYKSDHLSPKSL